MPSPVGASACLSETDRKRDLTSELLISNDQLADNVGIT